MSVVWIVQGLGMRATYHLPAHIRRPTVGSFDHIETGSLYYPSQGMFPGVPPLHPRWPLLVAPFFALAFFSSYARALSRPRRRCRRPLYIRLLFKMLVDV